MKKTFLDFCRNSIIETIICILSYWSLSRANIEILVFVESFITLLAITVERAIYLRRLNRKILRVEHQGQHTDVNIEFSCSNRIAIKFKWHNKSP